MKFDRIVYIVRLVEFWPNSERYFRGSERRLSDSLAGILPSTQIAQFTKRALLHVQIVRLVVHFVASIANRIPPAAVKALQLVGVDGQIVGFEMVDFANQFTGRFAQMRAFLVGRDGRAHVVLLITVESGDSHLKRYLGLVEPATACARLKAQHDESSGCYYFSKQPL